MPQIFQVLRCFKCLVFQVHQTKKSNKFQCKMCGEKQSIKRHYGLGTGQECRLHVQKLNSIRGEMEELNDSAKCVSSEDEENLDISNNTKTDGCILLEKSKWSNFLDQTEELPPSCEDKMYLNNTEVVLEVPRKHKKFYVPKATNKLINEVTDNLIVSTNSGPQNFLSSNNKSNSVIYKSLSNEKVEIKVNKPLRNLTKCNNNESSNSFDSKNVNPQSKWAEFMETHEEDESCHLTLSEERDIVTKDFFSTYDENELDDILSV